MKLFFVTGNQNKLREAKQILGDVESISVDLPEIQSLDSHEIIKQKLQETYHLQHSPIFCDDVSFEIKALNGFPGPLIKWLIRSIPLEEITKWVHQYSDHSVVVKSVIGFKDKDRIEFIEGIVKGKIVEPRGENGFGFDSIFLPEGSDKTFAEMAPEEKNLISHRYLALKKLKEFLQNNYK